MYLLWKAGSSGSSCLSLGLQNSYNEASNLETPVVSDATVLKFFCLGNLSFALRVKLHWMMLTHCRGVICFI